MTQEVIEPPTTVANVPSFDRWIFRLWKRIVSDGQVAWDQIILAGANLVDIGTRNHADLQNINTASYTHLTATQATDLTDAGESALHYHASDRLVSNHVLTSTNDNAAAGKMGEYIESVVASGSAVSLTTDTPANLTSLSFTAGDWDVRVLAVFDPSISTTVDDLHLSLSTTSATHDTSVDRYYHHSTNLGAGAHGVTLQLAGVRVSLASTTTLYAVTEATFGASTMAVYGLISARRVR